MTQATPHTHTERSMSLHVLYDGRKKPVKCGPNTTMQAVLEAACKEHGLGDPHAFALVHKKVRWRVGVGWMGGWSVPIAGPMHGSMERPAGVTDSSNPTP